MHKKITKLHAAHPQKNKNAQIVSFFIFIFLYCLLFLPDFSDISVLFNAKTEAPEFRFSDEDAAAQIVMFYIPAIFTVFCANKSQKRRFLPEKTAFQPKSGFTSRRRAAIAFCKDIFFTIAGLFSIALAVSSLSWIFPPSTTPSVHFTGRFFISIPLFFICSAVLEELFFRVYAVSALKSRPLPRGRAAGVSALLFTLPHLWEGPPGMLNALLAAFLLNAVYQKNKSLAQISAAHAAYNIAAAAFG
ncbi:MAG: CPBP family intramembrane metalloprotease [Spirochaetaceae bacterium]|jgi:membrane protease YdiL (CAAX protease family)|nr:CPBP family intramembrane metalloprotease [Spirochaetaceae bacterium]